MTTSAALWDYIDGELKRSRPVIHREFSSAAAVLKPILAYDDYVAWASEGVKISQASTRASEAAAEYFKASVPLLHDLRFVQFLQWCRLGHSLLQLSPSVAAAYYRASPAILGPLLIDEFDYWAQAGRLLSRDSWRGQSLATQFFEAAPRYFGFLSLEEVVSLATFIDQLSRYSADSASEYLERLIPILAKVEKKDRVPVLRIAALIASTGARPARAYADAVPDVLARFTPSQRSAFLALVETCAREAGGEALPFFLEASKSLAGIDPTSIGKLLGWAADIAKLSPAAAVAFIGAGPALLPRLGLTQLERWVQTGRVLLASNREAGLAYLRLQSKRAQDTASALSHVCELDGVKQVLRLYSKALTGREVQVRATSELVGKAIGWTTSEQATSDGATIFLPSTVEAFQSRDDNFAFYKVLATHQAGHIEFGTYDFACARPPYFFPNKVGQLLAEAAEPPAISDFERFFDLFADRGLAKHLFNVLEDGRVDTLVVREYGGIKRVYRSVQQHALEQRPFPFSLPLRQACVEQLLQLSLSPDRETFFAPRAVAAAVQAIAAVARRLWQARATVEDSAAATVILYDFLLKIRNVRANWSDMMWIDLRADLSDEDLAAALRQLDAAMAEVEVTTEEDFEGPEDVDFRGALKPELVQALMKVRRQSPDAKDAGSPISAEDLRRLLEKNANIEIGDLSEEELLASMGMFVNNLMKEKGKGQQPRRRKEKTARRTNALDQSATANLPIAVDSEEIASFHYDEWDCNASDYRPGWCRVSERRLHEGSPAFYKDTLHNNAGLVQLVRKQFEMLRPEAFKKVKRLHDGEEFDLDALIEAVVAKRSGHTPSEKVYWRRNKVHRDVAVAFLLDMSASTDEEIERAGVPDADDDSPRQRGRRIIDLEKESIVLLTEALQAIGDRYGIFGFSGYGHDNCEFYVVKDLNEDFSERVKQRIDKISPMRGTRMGPAIRHATAKLEAEEARLRILVLLSDGYPQDHDYHGSRHAEREYALHDTRMALVEAKRKNIVPFCLTVDKSGHDYLKTMCPDIGYEIVNDIRSLPRRLPTLYRLLTT